jgi:hypothetical protein
MAGERDWADLSFTPDGGRRYQFNDASVTFPTRDAGLQDGDEKVDPADIVGPLWVRIKSSNIGAIPRFPKGTVGTFNGTYVNTNITYSVGNAEVVESKAGDLILQADSLDGSTSPVGVSLG